MEFIGEPGETEIRAYVENLERKLKEAHEALCDMLAQHSHTGERCDHATILDEPCISSDEAALECLLDSGHIAPYKTGQYIFTEKCPVWGPLPDSAVLDK